MTKAKLKEKPKKKIRTTKHTNWTAEFKKNLHKNFFWTTSLKSNN